MRIAVNTRLLLKGKLEGLGRFTDETLRIMVQQHPEHEFFFLFDRPYDSSFVYAANVNPVVIPPPARHPLLWYLWFESSVPKALKSIDPDLFLSPDGFLPLRTDVPCLPVIHDLNFVHNPQDLAWSHAQFYNRYFPRYAKKAARIATVSTYSKFDIVQQYGVSQEQIDVVYNGVSERFSPLNDSQIERVRNKWSQGQPYFIFVGAIHPRKNVERMLQAFDMFRADSDLPFKFIFAGNRKWWTRSMQQAYDAMIYRSDVLFVGRVSDADLNDLMGAALANVYVSTFEGFGIPIIESFQSGVPVITSNTTSMPEIAGDAALLVDPYNVQQIAQTMKRLRSDASLRTGLVAKGKQRAPLFTWQRTADLLWASVEKALQGT